MSLAWRQALRLGIILLVCAGLTVLTSTFLQSPMGSATLTALVRRGGPEQAFQGAPNPGPGPQRVRGAAPGAANPGLAGGDVRPRGEGGEGRDLGGGGGRLAPNVRAGLPELLRSAGTMGLFALGVVVLLKLRKLMRGAAPARVRSAPRRPEPAR
jgi:hypothetical protein